PEQAALDPVHGHNSCTSANTHAPTPRSRARTTTETAVSKMTAHTAAATLSRHMGLVGVRVGCGECGHGSSDDAGSELAPVAVGCLVGGEHDGCGGDDGVQVA